MTLRFSILACLLLAGCSAPPAKRVVTVPSAAMLVPKTVVNPAFLHWQDTNGCGWSVINNKTNGPICPNLPTTNLTITCTPGGVFAVSNLVGQQFWRTSNAVLQVSAGLTTWADVAPLADGSVTLAWDASTDPNVAGYNIYYGGASGTYTNKIDAEGDTTATVSGLTVGATYYFAATTYSADAESLFSCEVAWTNRPILTIQ